MTPSSKSKFSLSPKVHITEQSASAVAELQISHSLLSDNYKKTFAMICPSPKAITNPSKRTQQLFEQNSPPLLEMQGSNLNLQQLFLVLPYRPLKRDLPTYLPCSLLPPLAPTRMRLGPPVSVARLLHLLLPLLPTLGRVNGILEAERRLERQSRLDVGRSESLNSLSPILILKVRLTKGRAVEEPPCRIACPALS